MSIINAHDKGSLRYVQIHHPLRGRIKAIAYRESDIVVIGLDEKLAAAERAKLVELIKVADINRLLVLIEGD